MAEPNYFLVYRRKGEYHFEGPYRSQNTAERRRERLEVQVYPESELSRESFAMFGDTGVLVGIETSDAEDLQTFQREFWQDHMQKFPTDRPSGHFE